MTDHSAATSPDLLQQLQRVFRNEKQRRRKTARLPISLLESLISYLKTAALRGDLEGAEVHALLLSTEETAELLGVSVGTLANWRTKGVVALPFIRCEGRVRYRASDVRDYLAHQQLTHTK